MTTSRKVFVNLPVNDLQKTVQFWTSLGFEFNPQFTDEHATCMVLSADGFVMLLDKQRFSDFTKKDIVNARTHTEVITALSADSRDDVDTLVKGAFAAGAAPANDPMDYGFMYGWSFQDLDGHQWEVIWMDPAAAGG